MENKSFARIKKIEKFLGLTCQGIAPSTLFKNKNITLSRNSIDKKILVSLRKKTANCDTVKKHVNKEEIKKLFFTVSEIKELPSAILNLPHLSSFESCHILVHEKGKPIGQNHLALHRTFKETKLISVQNFDSLFNLVKKSKHKIFNQSAALKEDLAIVGNFLAKEIELKNYSVIYIISRNSFLPTSTNEQSQFQSLSLFLSPLLIKILDQEKNNLQKDIISESLKKFPEKICIKKNSQVIFTNKIDAISPENSSLIIFPLEHDGTLTMELSTLSKDQISTELYHSQRVSLLGELLNTLQHELSNPLFGLKLTSSILEGEIADPEAKSILHEISHNAARSQTIIKNFSNLYSSQHELKRVKLCSFIEEVITLTKSETKEIHKSIECFGFNPNDPTDNLEIGTNTTYLTQIIFNLIINAAQAIKEKGRAFKDDKIIISLKKIHSHVEISIIDNGPGIKPEHLINIFDPFFTTKDSGTGLGLSICQNLARQLGSKIEFKNNSPLLGVTFSINLPI